MKKRKAEKRPPKTSREPRFKFQLYIGRSTRASDAAINRLQAICDETIPDDYAIEIIDLSKNPQLAKDHQIIATPSVFRTLPEPIRKSIGDLSLKHKAIVGLDLPTSRKAHSANA